MIEDVRSFRGAEIGSDHNLVVIKIRQKIKVHKNNKNTQKINFDLSLLKNPEVSELFKITTENRFTALESEETDMNVEDLWEVIKNTVHDSMTEVLRSNEVRKKKQWFDRECNDMIKARKTCKEKLLSSQNDHRLQEEYVNINRETKKLMRQKKRKYLEDKLKQAELDRTKNNAKEFYRTARYFNKGYAARIDLIKDNDGQLVADEKKALEIWRKYFKELLNTEGTAESNNESEIIIENEEEAEEPTLEEIRAAVKILKNGKAAGKDGIPTEVLKKGGEKLSEKIWLLMRTIWKEESIPSDWKESIICPILKKGDPLQCKNYRGISLLCTTYKILSIILLKRITPYVEAKMGPQQAGFRGNRSTVDQIHIFRQILSKCREFNVPVHGLFVDLKKAFDSIKREEIWKEMKKLSIPKKLINLTRITTEDTKCLVRVNGKLSEPFNVETGVKQGDCTSPLLFNLILEKVIRSISVMNTGITIGEKFNILAYADDVILIGKSEDEIKEMLTVMINTIKPFGLEVNFEKTKYMIFSREENTNTQTLNIGRHNLERVENFKYLGSTLREDNTIEAEILSRINSGNRARFALKKMLSSKLLTWTSKIRIYKTLIQPVIVYGAETWTLTKKMESKLMVFENAVLRQIFGPVKENGEWRRRKNRELRSLYPDLDIVTIVKKKRLQWYGHIKRRNNEELIKAVIEGNIEGRRMRGRPRLRWIDQVMTDMRRGDVNQEAYEDRVLWRRTIDEAMERLRFVMPQE
ncbi:hypothetical protein M8J77_006182 [Diaphorina citri]|nr:hypothetical protein M8J77_006182 [Diaphorina citri]